MCPAPDVVKVYVSCPILTTHREIQLQHPSGTRRGKGVSGWREATHRQVVGPVERGRKSPRTRGPPDTYSRMLSSSTGIWPEMAFAGEAEETAIGLSLFWGKLTGRGGEVQGVGRGVPSGKAAAEPAAVPR